MAVKNVVEDVVAREFEILRPHVKDFCGCDQCRDDVLVYALNRLDPRYVTQRTGEVVTNISMQSDQERARVSVVLLAGFDVVKNEPREGHS